MIQITHDNKLYHINEEKLIFTLEKLCGREISKDEIPELMKKFHLYDEYFLEHVNEL